MSVAMTEILHNHLGGRWVAGSGAGTALFDPVLGDELVRVDATGLDLRAGFAFAREQGGAALRAMSYRERAVMLAAVVKVLGTTTEADIAEIVKDLRELSLSQSHRRAEGLAAGDV